MHTIAKSTNQQLRELVEASGLPQAVALTVFNRGLGAQPCSESAWKGFLSDPAAPRFRALSDELLEHALNQFAMIGKRP